MAEARMQDAWQRTSAVMALIANVNRDSRRGRPFRPADFDPFAATDRPAKVGVEILKDVFVDGRLEASGRRLEEKVPRGHSPVFGPQPPGS